MTELTHQLTVLRGEEQHTLRVPDGSNLRRVLIKAGLSPYAALTQRMNCGGRGLCATCGVWINGLAPMPDHWHDRLANRFGYPRLSCQVTIRHDMTVRLLPDKRIWGGRDESRRYQHPGESE